MANFILCFTKLPNIGQIIFFCFNQIRWVEWFVDREKDEGVFLEPTNIAEKEQLKLGQ